MRQFVSVCCCAIVGLEVLIAVPLVTCLVVLGVIGGVEVDPLAMDGPQLTQQYSDVPVLLPPPINSAAFGGPAICPPPSICIGPPAQAPLAPEVAAIADLLGRVGSPLANSSLAGDCEATHRDSIDALSRAAQEDATPIATLKPNPEPAAQLCPNAPSNTCPEDRPAQPALVDSLQAAAEALYVRAQALEIDGNFGRADQLRSLAREIRREIDTLRLEPGHPVAAAPAVTPASYHAELPKEPAKLEADHP
ncbi:MAG: hypothetical protein L0211_17845, partial [Planctomycetaceae bacterium]|nr:hypothetical protein [Planctomycetaceae bacterium]